MNFVLLLYDDYGRQAARRGQPLEELCDPSDTSDEAIVIRQGYKDEQKKMMNRDNYSFDNVSNLIFKDLS